MQKLIPVPQRGALPGRSPGRGLLILRCESHPPLCVGLVWTFDFLADVIEFQGFLGWLPTVALNVRLFNTHQLATKFVLTTLETGQCECFQERYEGV